MKIKIISVFILVITLSIVSNCICSDTNSISFGNFLLRLCLDHPIFAYYDQTVFRNNDLLISKVGLGFDGEAKEKEFPKIFGKIQFLNLSGGYKYYTNILDWSFYFFDYCLFKTDFESSMGGGIYLGANLNLIDKQTTWYSNNMTDWISWGGGFGYDFTSSEKDLIIVPILYFGFSFSTFKPDTIVCLNLKSEYSDVNFNWLIFRAKLKTVYKSLSFDLSAKGKYGGSKNLSVYEISAELAYTLWKEGSRDLLINADNTRLLNELKFYISYNDNKLDITETKDNKSKNLYYIDYYIIKFGVSARIGKINFFD